MVAVFHIARLSWPIGTWYVSLGALLLFNKF